MSQKNVNINLNEFLGALSALERKNLPYAKAVALNNTAFQAKDALVSAMPGKFSLRSTRPIKGFRVEKATKKQLVPAATVMHLDNWMTIHEFGGTKQPTRGKRMAIPSKEAQAKGRTGSGKMGKRWQSKTMRSAVGFADPRAAGAMGGKGNKGRGNPKPFLLVSKNGERRIVRRTSRGGHRYDLIDLYYLKKSAKVKPIWHYLDTVKAVATKHLASNLVDSLARALATSTK